MLIIMRVSEDTSIHSQNERKKVFKINKNCNSYFEQIIVQVISYYLLHHITKIMVLLVRPSKNASSSFLL